MQRNPTVKNEINDKGHIFKNGNVTFGFLGYPVSQAADITFLRAHVVPVGEDQKPMLEQTNEIIRKFHNYYGELFPRPQGIYGEVGRLLGLDGRKMSKSFNNAIYLSDSLEDISKKVKTAQTDSDTINLIVFDEKRKQNVANLIKYYQIATGKSIEEIEKEFQGLTSYKQFKERLVLVLDNFLSPIRARRAEYEKNPDLVWGILFEGTARVKKEAEKTMNLVKEKMKILY